jgi:hypothetical protein
VRTKINAANSRTVMVFMRLHHRRGRELSSGL